MQEIIMKIQRRKIATFVTIPKKYAEKIKDVTHMSVRENDMGRLEYEPVRNNKEEVEQDER